MDNNFTKLDQLYDLDNIESELDYDYSVNETCIENMDQFKKELLDPFFDRNRQIFYRGERMASLKWPLLPTMLRDKSALAVEKDSCVDIDIKYILNHYKSNGSYLNLFNLVFGETGKYRMYELCAFSQHYLDWSPFIDFTKSIFVAISFAVEGKRDFENDRVLYTVEISDDENYTRDPATAERWLNNYHVRVYNCDRQSEKYKIAERTSPDAKIIDIATNDRMKFQQGVFLLLDNFNLVNNLYLTKNVRDSVKISKYILKREFCPCLADLVSESNPWYNFENLLDVKAGVQIAQDTGTVLADNTGGGSLRNL